jgi:hypothetical protein
VAAHDFVADHELSRCFGGGSSASAGAYFAADAVWSSLEAGRACRFGVDVADWPVLVVPASAVPPPECSRVQGRSREPSAEHPEGATSLLRAGRW